MLWPEAASDFLSYMSRKNSGHMVRLTLPDVKLVSLRDKIWWMPRQMVTILIDIQGIDRIKILFIVIIVASGRLFFYEPSEPSQYTDYWTMRQVRIKYKHEKSNPIFLSAKGSSTCLTNKGWHAGAPVIAGESWSHPEPMQCTDTWPFY